jgi:hypothetical protein
MRTEQLRSRFGNERPLEKPDTLTLSFVRGHSVKRLGIQDSSPTRSGILRSVADAASDVRGQADSGRPQKGT